jgi:hypothetical protein
MQMSNKTMTAEYNTEIQKLINETENQIDLLDGNNIKIFGKIALLCTVVISQTLLIIAKNKG